MATVGWLPAEAEELFGPEATAEESYEVLTVDVPPASWLAALETARSTLGCTFFDWLSAVDEPGSGFLVSAHVVALAPVRRLLVRTTVPHDAPALPSAVGVYAGAAWHERETHEMFGVAFEGHPGLEPLLLPETFEGHPLRKDFVLASRVAKAWPGAKEPGESEHGGPKRRQMLPPGVPDPNEWGPLKGQLPPAPARPARGAGRAAGAAAGTGARAGAGAGRGAAAGGDRPPRRMRSASQGSASQQAAPDETAAPTAPNAPRSPDAPWHHARPASDEPGREREPRPTEESAGGPAQESEGGPAQESTEDTGPGASDGNPDTENPTENPTENSTENSTENPAKNPTENPGGPQ